MKSFLRVIGNMTWALAFALSVGLAIAHHGYKLGDIPDIALGVSILSLILSALGLLLARHCLRDGDRTAAMIGIVVWMAGALSFSVTEFGFWHANYRERHANYVQIKAAQERQEGLKTMAWETLQTGETRATSAEMKARIAAVQQSDIWTTTKSCANATLPASRKFCGEYFDLVAKLAKIEKLEGIEAGFLAEKPDEQQKLANKVFAAADLIAETGLMNERQAAVLVILIVALVLMLSRDLLPIATNPLRGRKEALQPAQVVEAPIDTVAFSIPADGFPTPSEYAPREELDKLKALLAQMHAEKIGPNSPNSDHVRDATKKVDVQKDIGQSEPISAQASDKSEVAEQIAETANSPTLYLGEIEARNGPNPLSAKDFILGEIGSISPNSGPDVTTQKPLAHKDSNAKTGIDVTTPEVSGDVVPLEEFAVLTDTSNVTRLFKDAMPLPLVAEHPFSVDVKIKRRDRSDVKEFFRECLDIDQEAKAAMLHAIRERKALDAKFNDRLMDSPDVYDLYLTWYGESVEGAMGPKPFSNKLNDYIGLPPGTRKLKGVKGIRNAKGARFPVAEKVRKVAAA
jgi:hypothetical protein